MLVGVFPDELEPSTTGSEVQRLVLLPLSIYKQSNKK